MLVARGTAPTAKGCFGSGNVCSGVLLLCILTLPLKYGLIVKQGGEALCFPLLKGATAWRHRCVSFGSATNGFWIFEVPFFLLPGEWRHGHWQDPPVPGVLQNS